MNFERIMTFLISNGLLIAVVALILAIMGTALIIAIDMATKGRFLGWVMKQPDLVKNSYFNVTALCPREAFEKALQERKVQVEPTRFVEVPGTMTFSNFNDGEKLYVTGDLNEMNQVLKGCRVKHESLLYVPFTTNNNPHDLMHHRVLLNHTKQIVKSARPKPVRNFIQRHRLSVGEMMLIATLVAVVAMILSFYLYHNHSEAVQVNGDHLYAVGYDTSYGHVPNGQTFEELRSDPAVWGVMWSEKTDDPNINLYYDYNCHNGFWGNRCGWTSYAHPVRVHHGRFQ